MGADRSKRPPRVATAQESAATQRSDSTRVHACAAEQAAPEQGQGPPGASVSRRSLLLFSAVLPFAARPTPEQVLQARLARAAEIFNREMAKCGGVLARAIAGRERAMAQRLMLPEGWA